MNVSNEVITVKYQTGKEYCTCCSREFEAPELGEVREFDITLKSLFEWADWNEESEIEEDDIKGTVGEYLFDTISFYALNSNEILKICDGEESKVIELVSREIKNLKKCERCNEKEVTHLLDVNKHNVFIKTEELCEECFNFRIIGGE